MSRSEAPAGPAPPASLPVSSQPTWRAAQRARAPLSEAFVALQRLSAELPELEEAVTALAAASSALYEVETLGTTVEATRDGVRLAAEHLGEALALLQRSPDTRAHALAALCAETLGVLYPAARAQQRRRRAVMYPEESRDATAKRPSRIPPAPAPPRPRRATPYQGRDKRTTGGRMRLEVDIGMWSASNFYTGLSLDLSSGGLFVATYQPLEPGSKVCLYFQLPDGLDVEAEGRVAWIRDGGEDAPPGMGVRFEALGADALAAIRRFCTQRAPLYHQSGDE